MKVSPKKPFKIVYSLFEHEYLGYLFESFAIQLDEKGRLTFIHQNISPQNAGEFSSEMDDIDFKLINLMEEMQQDEVLRRFQKKKTSPTDFFLSIYDQEKGNKTLQNQIENYLDRKRSQILPLLKNKLIYEMNNDGEPAGKQIEFQEEKASVLFHFRRNEDNTHYFPTIKHKGEKLDFQYQNAYLACKQPAWMVLNGKLYSFEKEVDGNKLKPFLNKKFIVIPKKVEESYYKKFVAPLIASFDVFAKGFDIKTQKEKPIPHLTFSELAQTEQKNLKLFEDNNSPKSDGNGNASNGEEGKICFKLSFQYKDYFFDADQLNPIDVKLEKSSEKYIFHRVKRDIKKEENTLDLLKEKSLALKNARKTLPKSEAFSWLNKHKDDLEEAGIVIKQNNGDSKKYFLGESQIDVEVNENIDWFDIHAKIKFGEYEIPFIRIRQLMVNKQREFELPNGEIAVIPEHWITEYAELFAFAEKSEDSLKLKKHHVSLVQDLKNGNLAKVSINRKLEKLKDFDEIEEYPLPECFQGDLRPYQKAGYNWMQFLKKYNFGGCLADDMGLGKTIQTLALLQYQKEDATTKGEKLSATLLVMPTSLIYNWEMEAGKFTPELSVLVYTGTNREKDVSQFENYDIIITSYGIVRQDVSLLQEYYFNYIILDESQAIKNPASHVAQAVRTLNAKYRLILTGTPLENSTLDLWSQMTFVNPGLLGSKSFFKNEFTMPIEKKKDQNKTEKLYTIIKPFILRRQKWQVASELPEKVENVQYCGMTPEQEEKYEEIKSHYRNKILNLIEKQGLKGSQFVLLQGLTQLRQVANHPKMVDSEFEGESGKLQDVTHMLINAISKNHKVLVFSQFVKYLGILSKYLKEEGIDYAYLDGSTKDRKGQVTRFQEDENLKIFLISLKAGGLGLNLTEADYVFILDPWWNPAVENQAIDRAHRIGQNKKVFTYKFITRNTVEEKILSLQKNKIKLASDLISSEESFVKNLTSDDIESILT